MQLNAVLLLLSAFLVSTRSDGDVPSLVEPMLQATMRIATSAQSYSVEVTTIKARDDVLEAILVERGLTDGGAIELDHAAVAEAFSLALEQVSETDVRRHEYRVHVGSDGRAVQVHQHPGEDNAPAFDTVGHDISLHYSPDTKQLDAWPATDARTVMTPREFFKPIPMGPNWITWFLADYEWSQSADDHELVCRRRDEAGAEYHFRYASEETPLPICALADYPGEGVFSAGYFRYGPISEEVGSPLWIEQAYSVLAASGRLTLQIMTVRAIELDEPSASDMRQRLLPGSYLADHRPGIMAGEGDPSLWPEEVKAWVHIDG